jgi:hypothetical protein
MSATILDKSPLDGWNNLHVEPLPEESCNLAVIAVVMSHIEELVGRWIPNKRTNENPKLLGTFYFVSHTYPYQRLGLNAWRENVSDFTYFRTL